MLLIFFRTLDWSALEKVNEAKARGLCFVDQSFRFQWWGLVGLDDLKIQNCSYHDVELEGCIFIEAEIKDTSFTNTLFYDLTGFWSKFENCTFEDVDFLGCNLKETLFVSCLFKNVSFGINNICHRTNLSDADFQSSTFKNVVFTDIEFEGDSIPKLPKGVRLDEHGNWP